MFRSSSQAWNFGIRARSDLFRENASKPPLFTITYIEVYLLIYSFVYSIYLSCLFISFSIKHLFSYRTETEDCFRSHPFRENASKPLFTITYIEVYLFIYYVFPFIYLVYLYPFPKNTSFTTTRTQKIAFVQILFERTLKSPFNLIT